MGRHVIIGKGNLGLDLNLALMNAGNQTRVLTQSEGFRWPESISEILEFQPDYVWVTAGAGSVEQCKSNPTHAIATHITMPVELAMKLPSNIKVGVFSTDYACDELEPGNPNKYTARPKSFYACTKISMEIMLRQMNRPNVTIFRVSNLYGAHCPDKTFPGKLLKKYPSPCVVELPQNWVVPTPTWWIAENIVKYLGKAFSERDTLSHHLAPESGMTVTQWGRKVLGDAHEIKSKGFDDTRISFSKLGCTLFQCTDTCQDLLAQHAAKTGLTCK